LKRKSISKILITVGVIISLSGCNYPSTAVPNTPVPITPTPTVTASITPISSLQKPLLVGYFTGWSVNRGYSVAKIPAGKLSDVVYAFANISVSGECVTLNDRQDQANFLALKQLKIQYPELKTQISVGGASNSGLFSDVAMTAASRSRFARSCVQFMEQNGFDGIDIDWEYPVKGGNAGNHHSPADKQNFTALLAAIRTQLDTLGAANHHHYLLTIAAPAGLSEYANLELNLIYPSLDWISVMAYDFAPGSSPTTNFKSPLYPSSTDPASPSRRKNYNVDAAIKAYLSAGVPASKLVLGVAFYGQGWEGVPTANNGLYQTDQGPAQGTWAKDGVFGFQDLEKNYLPTYTRTFQTETMVPWLYSPTSHEFITYEDPQSLGIKADYVLVHQLAGMMAWELSFDDGQNSLVEAAYAHLHP
jgi:chitinase